MLTKLSWTGSTIPDCFAESRTVFIPKTSDIDDNGRMIRSPDALRPLTLCNCKLLTSAICRGLHWYTLRCIHSYQRCISSGQMTDNIFEIETTDLAHVACGPQESGVLLTDFAAAYPTVDHSWIFSVLENTGLSDFLCRFLRSIYSDSITHVEFAGADRGQFKLIPCKTGLSSGSKSRVSQGILTTWSSCSLHIALTLTTSLFLLSSGFPFCGLHHWPQLELPQLLLCSVWQRRTYFFTNMDLGELRRVP